MIPQFWFRFGVDPWGRHLLVALAIVAPVTRPTAAADEADVEASPEPRLVSHLQGQQQRTAADAAGKLPDPLKGTPLMSPERTGQDASKVLAKMLKPRSDSWADWNAPLEPLHRCGEPRALSPCVPPPPCHPSQPPAPYDLVGVHGVPSDGPIYEGPCRPRTGTHDDCPHPRLHRLYDRFFDAFYMWK